MAPKYKLQEIKGNMNSFFRFLIKAELLFVDMWNHNNREILLQKIN